MKPLIIITLFLSLSFYCQAQENLRYPIVYEGYPYFDEYGYPNEGPGPGLDSHIDFYPCIFLSNNRCLEYSPEGRFGSLYIPYLLNWNYATNKNSKWARVLSFYCAYVNMVSDYNSPSFLQKAMIKFFGLERMPAYPNKDSVYFFIGPQGDCRQNYLTEMDGVSGQNNYSNSYINLNRPFIANSPINFTVSGISRESSRNVSPFWKVPKKEVVVHLATSTLKNAPLAKYTISNHQGNILVEKKFKGFTEQRSYGSNVTLVDAVITPDNCIIIVANQQLGSTYMTIDNRNVFSVASMENQVFWCVKINSEGTVLWEKNISSGRDNANSTARLTCIRLLKNGDILLGGNQQGEYVASANITGAGMTADRLPKPYNTQFFVCRVSSGGELLWKKTYPATGENRLYDILSNDEKRIYLVGTSYDHNSYKLPQGYPKKVDISGGGFTSGGLDTKYEKPTNMLIALVIDENGNLIEKSVINTKPEPQYDPARINDDARVQAYHSREPSCYPYGYNVFAYGYVILDSNENFRYHYRGISAWVSGFSQTEMERAIGLSIIPQLSEYGGITPAFTIRNVPSITPVLLAPSPNPNISKPNTEQNYNAVPPNKPIVPVNQLPKKLNKQKVP